jgi:hypothetical protein
MGMSRAGRTGPALAVAAGLAVGLSVGLLLLVRQTSFRSPVELGYADPDYIAWLDSAGLAEGLQPANPEELPLEMYDASVRCSKPPCGCWGECGEPFVFEVDPANTPTPEQEIIATYKLPEDEVNLYKKAWNSYDGRRGGKILTRLPGGELNTKPLATIARMLGTNPRESDLQYTLGQVDPDGKGIDYPQFLLTMARHAPAWPVAVSESLAIPISVEGMQSKDTQARFKNAIAGAAEVQPDKVAIVRVRPAPGGAGSIVDFNVDASKDDMELMKASLTSANINENLAKFSLPQVSKGPEYVRGVETFTLPVSAESISTQQQDAMKAAIIDLVGGAMQKAGQDWKGLDDVSIVRIQGVNGQPNQASVDIGIEAANDAQFGLIKRFLQPGALGDAFAKQGLERPSDLKLVTLPNAFTPGCARCMGTSPYVDGDDLGKDHVGNSPFDEPLSRYQAEEVHRFDSDKPICECDNDRR